MSRRPTGDGPFVQIVILPDSILSFVDTQFDATSVNFDYLIKATEDSVGYESTSNIITLEQKPTIFIPSAFTPNDDGANEFWLPVTFLVKDMHVTIYNRWGNLVFETYDKELPWDGNFKGSKAPQGVYYYFLTFTNYSDNVEQIKKGSVALIR